MKDQHTVVVEQIQKLAAKLLATHPVGHRLCLVGGFRYRLLSARCRTSIDIDYHWEGDLARKQADIIELLRKKLLPEVKTRLGYDGSIQPATGPETDSPIARVIDMAFYRLPEGHRIEVPVEITRIQCSDSPIVRTVEGTVFLTASDADMIESKVIALFNRTFLEERDIVDLFLYQDSFVEDSAQRLQAKLAKLGISSTAIADRFTGLLLNRAVHIRALDEIIENQVEAAVVANLKASGGGGMVFDAVVAMLKDKLTIAGGSVS